MNELASQTEMGSVLERFYLAVEHANDHIIMTDPKGVIVYANHAAEVTTGYSRAEMLGKTPALWGRQMERSFYDTMWHTIAVEKRAFVGELKNMRKGGVPYDAEIRVSPILDKDGEVLFYVGVERDVTALKDFDRAKTEFISLASHNLKGPISAVKWYAEMLLAGDAGNLPEKALEYTKEIHGAGSRMSDLVGSLLSISKMDLGTIHYEVGQCDLGNLVHEVVKEFSTPPSPPHSFETYVEEGVSPLAVDCDLLREIIRNLVGNAVKYNRANEKIEVRAFRKRAGEEVYGRHFADERAVVVVKDKGIGIPPAEQAKVFQQFFRGTNAQSLDPQGTGLGLYLVLRIVGKMSGDIWFSSKEGEGTEFYLALPYGQKPV